MAKKYWAGYVDNKIYVEARQDSYGLAAVITLYPNKKNAQRRFQDVREVELAEKKE